MSGRHRLGDDPPTERLFLGYLENDYTQPLWPVTDLDAEGNEHGNRLVRTLQALRKWTPRKRIVLSDPEYRLE